MAYNTIAIKTDVNKKPVPQYYNPTTDQFELITSKDGMLRVILFDSAGNEIVSQSLVNQIANKLDELIQVVNQIGV